MPDMQQVLVWVIVLFMLGAALLSAGLVRLHGARANPKATTLRARSSGTEVPGSHRWRAGTRRILGALPS